MAQEIFNGLNNNQKTRTRHIIFQKGQSTPFSFSNDVLNIFSNSGKPKGELDLELFPNLRKITFQNNVILEHLESIDLSKNEKLSKLVIEGNRDYQRNLFFHNNNFILIIKEMQSNRIIACYNEYGTSREVLIEKYKYLREQAIIPYLLVEDRKLEQLGAEIIELRQSLRNKDQIIDELNKKVQQTPTLNQFRELNNIALGAKNTFEQLTATTKNKAGDSLKSILDLFLQTNKQIIESEDEGNNNDSFVQGQLQGQLTTCRTLLQTKFTQEELKSLLNKQKELRKLEKHSFILQQ
ncbi:16261_t:CDS:2 [Dentiscutata heterogama]|uniref:16261_t:CDS:1 n=1 Tax=Dentiscutata heterogama TaxID=1316150 RepID=A0ACA9LII9_9GLOM|nr:16261_t:CDS:2 [Dentiscutata heterogama]